METKQQTIDRIEQAAWDSETIRFRASKREAFKNVLGQVYDAAKDAQIKHMVGRFLQWRLPENFNPDGGISFKKTFNEHTSYPMKHEPVGTNLFDYAQAEEMVRFMTEGM